MATIYIPFYSRYGNVETLAKAVAEGVREAGAEPQLAYTGDVVTPPEIRAKDEHWLAAHERLMGEYPLVCSEALANADGAIFGSPTRFGNMAAQLKGFIDSLAGVWLSGATIGKPAGTFTSTASLHGGQETTNYTMWAPLVHLGYIIVGVPYSTVELLTTTTGGTPYGPSHVAGPMADIAPDATELQICRVLGKRVAEIATILAAAKG
jgi:NAD(P)H dehydrogenase (quinone)